MAQTMPLEVFAAASLTGALTEVGKAWMANEPDRKVRMTFAATPALARQIEQSSPADVFVSADREWMDYLDGAGLIAAASRLDVLGNSLVLIAPKGASRPITLSAQSKLTGELAGSKLAMADVRAVPAGRYGKAALERLGLWSQVERHVASAENVRVALALVARGEARLGIVYGTDALAEAGVEVMATFPANSHPPIVYPAARLARSVHPHAQEFLDFLRSDAADGIFRAKGFTPLNSVP